MKKSRLRLLLLLNVLAVGGLFFITNQRVNAQWILRNATAVYPVAACRDGVYIGVGTQVANVNPVVVTAELLPGQEQLFSKSFNLTTPADPNVYPFLVLADFYFVTYDSALAPLEPGDQVDLNPNAGIEIIATVGDCYLNPTGDPLTPTFTYQGRLDDGGSPANGAYDMRFRVYDAEQNGNQVGALLTRNDVVVANGLFTAQLNFGGNVFTGDERWLVIEVRDGNSTGAYTTLTPRQEITAVPYALGLRPGATISGVTSVDKGILTLKNNTGEGLVIERAHTGVIVKSTVASGLRIDSSDGEGVYINKTGRDGLVVWDAGGNGIYVNQAEDYAASFFGDVSIFGGTCTGCTLAAFGLNTGATPLQAGDIVVATGMAPTADSGPRETVMNVTLAQGGQAVIGVVASAAELTTDDVTGELRLVPRKGTTAEPGDYVSIIIYGITQVKVSKDSGAITAGERVALSANNSVRALQTTEVNGIQVAESVPALGTALQDFVGTADGMLWILINPR